MHENPSTLVPATVLIPFEDHTGSHSEGETIMLPAGTSAELDDLRRLVEYRIVHATVPGDPTMGVFIPDTTTPGSEEPSPVPAPAIPPDVVVDPLTHLPRVGTEG